MSEIVCHSCECHLLRTIIALDNTKSVQNKQCMDDPKFKKSDVDVRIKETLYEGFFRMDRYFLRHEQFAGGRGPEINREMFERGHAVAVLPYDPVTDEVILIEQFRPGAYVAMNSPWFDDDASPWMIEAIAGMIEPGEDPEDVAVREMREETGTETCDLIPMCHYLVSPGGCSESVFVFVGRADSNSVSGIHGVDHEGEDIRPFKVLLNDAYDGIADGKIINGMTIIALQWLMLNKAKVLDAWR